MSGERLDERLLNIDDHGVLRIPGAVWLAFAVLARHWVLVLVLGVSAAADPSVVRILGEGGVPWTMLVLQLPVALLALAGAQRRPEAGTLWRMLWRQGRAVMALTAALNAGWTVHWLMGSEYWLPWPELFLGSCVLIDAAIGVALFTAPYYRQLFREFPARSPARPRR